MDTEVLTVHTGRHRGAIDLTPYVAEFVRGRGDGLLSIFLPHATAGLAIVETGAGSDADLLDAIDELLPRDDRWRHRHGARGHGADHLLPAFLSPSLMVPVVEGRPALGTWQSIVLVDPNVDNPERLLRLTWLPA